MTFNKIILIIVVLVSLILWNIFYAYPNIKQVKSCRQLFKDKYPTLPYYYECGERLSCYENIYKDDIVLEIGGNMGLCSVIIADNLRDSSNLVVVEPSLKAVKKLNNTKQEYNHKFHIFNGCISKTPLYIKNNYFLDYVSLTDIEKPDYLKVENLTYNELEKKYNLHFNTLVIDCEGCYTQLFYEFPEILQNVSKILIEWDGKFQEKLFIDQGFYKKNFYRHPFLINGVAVYIKE
jgi:FkbM family methyltransferase